MQFLFSQTADWDAWCVWQTPGDSGTGEDWSGDHVCAIKGESSVLLYRGPAESQVQVSRETKGKEWFTIVQFLAPGLCQGRDLSSLEGLVVEMMTVVYGEK